MGSQVREDWVVTMNNNFTVGINRHLTSRIYYPVESYCTSFHNNNSEVRFAVGKLCSGSVTWMGLLHSC